MPKDERSRILPEAQRRQSRSCGCASPAFRPEWEAQRVIEVAGAKMLSKRRSGLPEEVFDVIADKEASGPTQLGFSAQRKFHRPPQVVGKPAPW
jgi:hypothetical protein